MSFQLRQHQEFALEMMSANSSLLLAYGIGVGKTAIALTWVRDALKNGKIKDALVICPASLVPMWEKSIEEMIKFDGWTDEDVLLLKDSITIRSYQKTYMTEKKPVRHNDGVVTYSKKHQLREDVDKYWGALICDESHSLGSHKSIQTKSAIMLSKLSEYVFLLTGTPTHGGGGAEDFSKLYGQMQVLSKGTYFKNWTDFCNRYVTRQDKWFNPAAYNVEGCRKILKEHAIVCRLEDCVDMPDKIEQDIPCELVEKQVYKDLRIGDVEKYDIDIKVAGSQYVKMLQVCSGSMKREIGNLLLRTSKDDALADILNGTDDPVVVFCQYRESIDRCMGVCRKVKRKAISLDGRSKGDEWKDFDSGRYDTIVCQYQSGGAGLNLQRAHIMIFFEPCMSSLQMEQAKGRIYRQGQNEKCIYYYLVTPKSVEQKVLDTVRSGVDVNNNMLNEWAQNGVI